MEEKKRMDDHTSGAECLSSVSGGSRRHSIVGGGGAGVGGYVMGTGSRGRGGGGGGEGLVATIKHMGMEERLTESVRV